MKDCRGYFIFALISSIACNAAFGEDAQNVYDWVGVDPSAKWNVAANWSGGTIYDVSNAENSNATVRFNSVFDYVQTVLDDSTATQGYIGALEGSKYHNINMGAVRGRTINIKDPSGFYGILGNGRGCDVYAWSGFTFLSTPEFTSYVNRLKVQDAMHIRVATDGKVQIADPIGMGAFKVNDTDSNQDRRGTVEFLSSPGRNTDMRLIFGKAILHGASDDASAPVAGAWLHLDASKADTLVVDGDGYVTSWRDAGGSDVAAEASGVKPRLTTSQAGGLNVVDFGKNMTGGAKLVLNETTENAKELFIVFKDDGTLGTSPRFVGWTKAEPVLKRPATVLATSYAASASASLFVTDASTLVAQTGDVRVDGAHVLYDYRDNFSRRLRTVSIGGDAPLKIGVVAGEGSEEDALAGGLQIAELLVYTNTLSSASRRSVNAYLMKKWMDKDAKVDYDFNRISLERAATEIEVASGTVNVKELELSSSITKLVKKGEGTLVLDRVSRNEIDVEIEGGALQFVSSGEAASVSAPAPDPDMWFDANDMDSMAILESNDCKYVTQWNDRRDGTNMYGICVRAVRGAPKNSSKLGAYAVLETNQLNGKNVIDFGEYYSTASADDAAKWGWEDGESGSSAPYKIFYSPKLTALYNRIYSLELFAVVCKTHSAPSVFTVTDDNTLTGNGEYFLHPAASTSTLGGYITVFGEPVIEPGSYKLETGEWYVISIKTTYPVPLQGFAHRLGANHGGLKYAELVTYDRYLTDKERRDTIAYLINKWVPEKSVDPFASKRITSIPSYKVASGLDLVLGGDESIAIGDVETDADTIVKTGKGNINISSMSFDSITNISSVSVSGGSLSLPDPDISALLATTTVRFDASDATTLTTEKSSDGTKDLVVQWADANANGYRAIPFTDVSCKSIKNEEYVGTEPVLTTRTINGKEMKVVDFGFFVTGLAGGGSYYAGPSASGAGALAIVRKMTEITWDPWRFNGKNYDVYVAMADNPDCGNKAAIVDTCTSDKNIAYRAQSGSGILSENNAKIGSITLDGDDAVIGTTAVTDTDFHVYSISFTDSAYFGALGMFRTGGYAWRFGGKQIGEIMYFPKNLDVREREAILKYLRNKWCSAGAKTKYVWEELNLEEGALALSGGAEVSVPVVKGSGTLNADALRGVTRLDLSGPLTVNGAFSSTDSVTVNIDSGFDMTDDGLHPIVSAQSLEGVDISDWTLNMPVYDNIERQYKLVKNGNTIYVKTLFSGLMIFVK